VADTLLGTTNMMENLMRYLVLAAGLACLSAAVGLLASETAWGGPCDPTHIPKTKICRPIASACLTHPATCDGNVCTRCSVAPTFTGADCIGSKGGCMAYCDLEPQCGYAEEAECDEGVCDSNWSIGTTYECGRKFCQ